MSRRPYEHAGAGPSLAPVPVYLPADSATFGIWPGSGIVGHPRGDRIRLDFEGHRDGSTTWADRIYTAWGRHVERYPTRARRLVPLGHFHTVGIFCPSDGRVVLDPDADLAQLERWISCDVDDEQLLTTSGNHALRRTLITALQQDPASRRAAIHAIRSCYPHHRDLLERH